MFDFFLHGFTRTKKIAPIFCAVHLLKGRVFAGTQAPAPKWNSEIRPTRQEFTFHINKKTRAESFSSEKALAR